MAVTNNTPSGASTTSPHRASPGTIIARIAIGIVAFIILLMIILVLLPDSVWKKLIVHEVSSSTGRAAAIDGRVQLHVFSLNPSIRVDGFRLANADWAGGMQKPMVSVQRFEASVSLWSLLTFHPVFPRIAVTSPTIDLERDAQDRANWDFSSPGAKKPQKQTNSAPLHLPVIHDLSVTDGKLAAADRIRKLVFNGGIGINEQSKPNTDALHVNGSGSLNEKPFDLDVTGGALVGVDSSKPYTFTVAVKAADIKLDAQTDVLHPFDLGAVRSSFHLTGKDLADAYYLTGLALPNTPPYDVSGTVSRNNMVFTVDDLHGRLGGSDIEGKTSVDMSAKRPKLTATLNSKVLDFADLAAPLGSQAGADKKSDTIQPVEPKGTGKHAATAAKPAAKPAAAPANALLLPDADLQVNRVRAMDADVTFHAQSVSAPKMPMKNAQFHLVLNDGRLRIDPLQFTLPQGQFSGAVGIDAHGPVPVTDLDLRIINVNLGQFKPQGATEAPIDGELLGRIKLHGSGTSVHKTAEDATGDITVVVPHGEMRSAFAELTGINVAAGLGLLLSKGQKQTDVRCGVVSFHAGDGDLKATTMVFDTSNVIVTGSGDINLRNEAIDMSIRGQPKQVRFVRIRSPITIHGTLEHPAVGLKTSKLLEQAGAAAALGTLLTPIAAVLAFVDPGLGKNADCAAVVGGAEQSKGLPDARHGGTTGQ